MTHFLQNQQQALLNGQGFKQDTNMLRSNELLHNTGATVIERDVQITEQRMAGSPIHMHGSPSHIVQGSPRIVQGSPRLIQGSPTGLMQGSPCRQTGFNQSLAQTGFNQSLGQTFQQTNFVQNQGVPHIHVDQHQHQQQFQQQSIMTGQSHIEKIYEKPIIVQHHEAQVVQSLYEGRQLLRVDETDVHQSHTLAPIVKEIHQDVIHQHHKDILVEHKKDIVHEHHQNIIHEHNQPIVYEKHIHEHHQPIIHEKHTTLVEEKHVPIVRETHLQATNVQTRQDIIHEVFDKPVVTETFAQPIVHTTQVNTIVESSGSSGFSQGHIHTQGLNQGHIHTQGLNQGHIHTQGLAQGYSQGGATIIEETTTTTDRHMGGTTGYIQEGYGQDTYLGDNRTYVNQVDEFGRPVKAGFFQNLKTKMGGKKNKEPKIL